MAGCLSLAVEEQQMMISNVAIGTCYFGPRNRCSCFGNMLTVIRIYISGDTLLIDELAEIPKRYTHADKPIDLMLIHLGGTTIPGPSLPLLMVTMDAKQGIELVRLINPEVTIPIHYE